MCKLESHDLTSDGSVVIKNYPIFMKNTWIWISVLRSFRWNCQISAIVKNETDFFIGWNLYKLGHMTSLKRKLYLNKAQD